MVHGHLGAGAMGVVYLAEDVELDRKVAIKLLHDGVDDEGRRLRLVREAQAMAKVTHPNVAAIHAVGTVGDQVYFVMEYIAGRTLREWLAARRRTWREILSVFVDVGRGLAAIHGAGLIHRDLKPENVMIGEDGRARVMDFGLARTEEQSSVVTSSGIVVGTPAYMAPEQLYCQPVSVASDQYSFCVALHEALYGRRPLGASALEHGEPLLDAVLARGLSAEPRQRFTSMLELLFALELAEREARLRPSESQTRGLVGLAMSLGRTAVLWARFGLEELTQEE
ncbi:MAG: serine/threonine protein kinase [Myxococcales bacterium]|nr:serine/threonine protein kinase [Myxococcales bacterium]